MGYLGRAAGGGRSRVVTWEAVPANHVLADHSCAATDAGQEGDLSAVALFTP